MSGMVVLPLFQFHNCDESCCGKEVQSCCSFGESEGCTMTFNECNTKVFVPFLSGPFVQQESSSDLYEFSQLITVSSNISDMNASIPVDEIIHPPEPPPSFSIPLLI